MSIPSTPIFVKTHDFILWLLERTQRFPRRLRHSYTIRLENTAFDFEKAILMANQHRNERRLHWLNEADGHLACLRSLLKYAYDLELLAGTQIEFAARQIDEVGRLLGAWLKGTGR